uniref:Uncharacterized protein n=1 Tax=Anguilla anguilla TaxID=7936 RepID=A0A0E9T7A6_ANGAN
MLGNICWGNCDFTGGKLKKNKPKFRFY